jgi:hypothetical protein
MTRVLFLSALLSSSALAHDAPTGWSYPFQCCSNQDCREVPDASVKETPSGYLASNGETIPYADKRIKDSPDGKFHLCTIAGWEDGRALCLFVPAKAY